MNDSLCTPDEHLWSRRRVLGNLMAGAAAGVGAGGLGGLLHPAVAEEIAKSDKQILFLWLDGGISQYESWDPKPFAPVEYRGEMGTVQTRVEGLLFNECLTKTAAVADQLADGGVQLDGPRGGWLCRRKGGAFVVLDADGREVAA